MKHKENKSLSHVLNVPVRSGELTVVRNTHAEDAMRHSIRLAHEANQAGIGVLVVNCGMSDRRFREHFNEVTSEKERDPRLVVHTASRGNLVKDRDVLEPIIAKSQIGLVIIVGWEWASDSYKRTRKLYTFLREMMDQDDVTLVVYANANHEIEAGRLDQKGLGKLTLMAYAACEVNSVEKLEKLRPMPKPLVSSSSDHLIAEMRVAELVRKINTLPRENRDDAGEYAVAA